MKNKKGFTLVELSIVLVIIGLLIGGILVAQSMIGTAKIQALSRQIGQFDAAVENFITKYNQMPGDTGLMGVSVGNNNGQVTDASNGTSGLNGEIGKFWADLMKSGLASPNGSALIDNYSGATSTLSQFAPRAVAGQDAYFLAFGPAAGQNFYFIGNTASRSFKPAEALALDTKLDDGVNNTGYVKGSDYLTPQDMGSTVATANLNSGTNCASAAATYAVARSTNDCNIRVRIGTTTGNPH